MSLQTKKQKDAANAARMKALKIERTYTACAICHRTVGLFGYEAHLLSCKGR